MNTLKEFWKIKGKTIARNEKEVCVLLSEETKGFFYGTVEKIAKESGYSCNSFLDYPPGNGLEYVWKNVLQSQFIIADITNFSPSVMYELGSTLAFKETQDVIIICDTKERGNGLPFNISQLNVNFYDQKDEKALAIFRKKLSADIESIRIRSTIEDPIRDIQAKKYVEEAMEQIEERKWMSAEVLFKAANELEPNNWKILKEWGRLYRLMGDNSANAREKLDEALANGKHPINKSEILVEYALFHDSVKDRERAEAAFNQAEESYNKDKNLYLAWARFYTDKDEFEDALAKILHLRNIDKRDKKAKVWFQYLTRRIDDKNFKLTFKEFDEKRGGNNKQKISNYNKKNNAVESVPYNIPWEEFKDQYQGKVIFGTVRNKIRDGVIVSLTREISGFIGYRFLKYEQKDKLTPNLRIKVLVRNAFISKRDGSRRVTLQLISTN